MKITLLLVGLLCLSFTTALSISEEYNTNVLVKDVDSQIELTLKITNATYGTYNLYTLSDVSLTPTEMFTISGGEITKTFIIKPTENLNLNGHYTFIYTLNQREVEKFDNKFTVNILDLEDVIQISSETVDINSDQITFYIQNTENTELKNLSAKFSSILFDTEQTFNLGPHQKLEITLDIDNNKLKTTKAGVYIIESVFQTNDGEKKIYGNLYLGEKKGITSTEDKSGLIIRTETITKINSGNVVESVEIKLKRNIISRLFTSFNTEPAIVERKGLTVEYTWLKERLNPAEVFTIKAKTNYVLPFFIIIIAALALFGYKRLRETKVEIKKSVSPVKTKNDEFALKITLAIKAKKSVENLSLIDKIPAVVKIYNKFGTVKPDKIDTSNRRIHWNLGDLNAGEVRFFSYIVYSKVGVVGKFSLPEATAIFEKNDTIHEVKSNKVFFMSDQIKEN